MEFFAWWSFNKVSWTRMENVDKLWQSSEDFRLQASRTDYFELVRNAANALFMEKMIR